MHTIISLKYAVGLLVVLYSQIYVYMSKASSLCSIDVEFNALSYCNVKMFGNPPTSRILNISILPHRQMILDMIRSIITLVHFLPLVIDNNPGYKS